MKKALITLFIFSLIFEIATIQAQKVIWLQSFEKGWTYEKGYFKNEKGEKKQFSKKENKWINHEYSAENDIVKDSLSKLYESVSPIGSIGFVVKKYGMTAVVSRENNLIIPYADDISNASLGENNTIFIKSRGFEYSYDAKGNLVKFNTQHDSPKILNLYLSYRNNVLYDYEKRKILSDTFQSLDLAYSLKNIFIAEKNGKCGIINDKNETILPFEYQELSYHRDSACIAKKYGEYALISLKGKVLIPYSTAKLEARRGTVIIQPNKDGKYAGFNLKGEKLTEPIYQMIFGTEDGVLWGEKNSSESVPMDKNGKILNFEPIQAPGFVDDNFFKGIAHYAKTKTGWGLQRNDGTWIVPPFSSKGDFIKSGFIQLNKKDIANFNLSNIVPCASCEDDFYYFNTDFKLMHPSPCRLSRFKETKDTFWVNSNRKTGLITRSGQVIIPVEYETVDFLNDSCIAFNKDRKLSLKNKKGREVALGDTIVKVYNLDFNRHFVLSQHCKGVQNSDGTLLFNFTPLLFDLRADKSFYYLNRKAYTSLKNKGADECIECKENNYILDKNGKLIIKTPAQINRGLNEKLFETITKGKSGIVDTEGRIVLDLVYDRIIGIDDNTFYVLKDNELGIIEIKW